MNFQEKYDDLIDTLERMIADNQSKREIFTYLSEQNHCSQGELAAAFYFITNQTLNDYIFYRQSVHQMNYRFQTGRSLESLAEEFNISDASALSKRIKKSLKKSPIEITPEYLSAQTPLTFDRLISKEDSPMSNVSVQSKKSSTHFGIDDNQFKKIQEALELSAVYNFSDDEAEFAYGLCDTHHASLAESFEFLDGIRSEVEYQTFPEECSDWLHFAATSEDFPLEELARLCLRYSLSVSDALDDIKFVSRYGYPDFSKLPQNFFDIYYSKGNQDLGLPFDTLIAVCKALDETGLSVADFNEIAFNHYYGNDIVSEIRNPQFYDDDFDDDFDVDFS